ncbi:hypothetical protein HD554DRAFT_2059680 [Boletus coccyginus]|nr:hypothetical protein HD554DRAFT_2059680 [Boletus coccyginus]
MSTLKMVLLVSLPSVKTQETAGHKREWNIPRGTPRQDGPSHLGLHSESVLFELNVDNLCVQVAEKSARNDDAPSWHWQGATDRYKRAALWEDKGEVGTCESR